ncbi:MAG: hypothetical protein LBV06_09450 [Propionibacteriaceae bacterium]|nr:hypothetical protein [Propionibacteriaceae bacterium]
MTFDSADFRSSALFDDVDFLGNAFAYAADFTDSHFSKDADFSSSMPWLTRQAIAAGGNTGGMPLGEDDGPTVHPDFGGQGVSFIGARFDGKLDLVNVAIDGSKNGEPDPGYGLLFGDPGDEKKAAVFAKSVDMGGGILLDNTRLCFFGVDTGAFEGDITLSPGSVIRRTEGNDLPYDPTNPFFHLS